MGALTQYRNNAGLTMREAAERVHISQSTLQRYESGYYKKIPLPVAKDLSQLYGVDTLTLLVNSTSEPPTEGYISKLYRQLSREDKFKLSMRVREELAHGSGDD